MSTESKTIRMVDTLTQYAAIREEVNAAIQEVLDSGAYINGPAVGRFREHLTDYLGAERVIPCANGTDALQIALMALDLEPGDEVITSPFTFFATAEVIALLRLKPVFVDIEPGSFNIDPARIEAAITERTRAIIPVHLFGLPADMDAVMEVANRHDLYVIEDNAQAIGADYMQADGSKVKAGLIGHIGCTSFYPSKNLGAYGDGGAIFTNDTALGDKLQMICNHGSDRRYYHSRIGVNSRLDAMQAAVLDVKLKHLDSYSAARRRAADTYDRLLGGHEGLITPPRKGKGQHVFHQYTLRVKEGRERRDRLQQQLSERGVPAMIYYPVPLHLQEAYAPFGYKEGDFPISEKASEEVISLPMHSELDEAQLNFIAQSVLDCMNA